MLWKRRVVADHRLHALSLAINQYAQGVASKGLIYHRIADVTGQIRLQNMEPLLFTIRERLSGIVEKIHENTDTPNPESLGGAGEDLVNLANQVYNQLVEVEHKVLFNTLRDAGLGVWARSKDIRERSLFSDDDKIYFTEVHDVLKHLCDKIETGEYYRELVKWQSVRGKSHRQSGEKAIV